MLVSGTTLGPFKILTPLGSGGMGEVYRAHDSRLGRDVAIKVRTSRLSLAPEARARFEREARAEPVRVTDVDSIVIFVMDPAAASAPVRLGYGFPLWWTSPGELLTYTVGHGTLAMTLDGRSSRQSPDSTIIVARLSAGSVVYYDSHEATKGYWLGRSESPGRLVALRRVIADGAWWTVERSGGAIYRYVSDGRLVRLDAVTGRETRVSGSFSGLTTRSNASVSADGHIFAIDGGDGPLKRGDRPRAVELDGDGRVLDRFGSYGKGPGQFLLGHDIAVARDGSVYVADATANRVLKFVRKSGGRP